MIYLKTEITVKLRSSPTHATEPILNPLFVFSKLSWIRVSFISDLCASFSLTHWRGIISAPEDVVLGAEELRYAAQAIGKVSGLINVEDILDAVFRDFCIGK